MDSVSQFVLGAAVGELCLGKKIGNKALLIGGIAGTVPDLDVIMNPFFTSDLDFITIHRGYSHAFFTHFLLAFPLAYLCYKIFRKKILYKEWYLLWVLSMTTHAILDSFTAFGTRLFLPFSNQPISFNNINIIDPLYTLPFLGFLVVLMFMKKERPQRRRTAIAALTISTLYIGLTFVNKAFASNAFKTTLKAENISYQELLTTPTFFNSVLWAGVAYDDSMLYCGEYSLLQKNDSATFGKFPRKLALEKSWQSEELSTLIWFSNGFYLLDTFNADTLKFHIAKWGRMEFNSDSTAEAFRFHYKLFRQNGKMQVKAVEPELKEGEFKLYFSKLWHRILSEK